MPIKNFRKREKLRPLVEVQIGANVPVGCKNHPCYADSSDDNKCVDPYDGQCKYAKKEMAVWKRNTKPRLCPMAGMNENELKKRKISTRPTQLGYFKIPAEYRDALNLPARPTEIPNVCVISDWNAEKDGLIEPIDVIHRYPVMDYYLAWWNATECVCKGDGELANWYPFSPAQKHSMKSRRCMYRDCPDFDGKTKCKAVGEFYFRLPNTPGYPGLWRFSTRSSTAIEVMLMELEQIHTALGGIISRIPLKLVLKKERAKYTDGKGTQRKTEVYRVHVQTTITMDEAYSFRREIKHKLLGDGEEIKMIASSTPDVPPPPSTPVEENATAPQEQWGAEEVVGEIVEEEKQLPAKEEKPKQPEISEEEKLKAKVEQVVQNIVDGINKSGSIKALKTFMMDHKGDFTQYVSLQDIQKYKDKAKNIYLSKLEELKAWEEKPKQAPKQEQKPDLSSGDIAPDPSFPSDETKEVVNEPASTKQPESSGNSDFDTMRDKLYRMINNNPPDFEESAAVDMINIQREQNGTELAKSINDFSLQEMQEVESIFLDATGGV